MPFQRSEIEPFRCEVEPRREVVYIQPVGELDLQTVPVVEERLTELAGAGFDRLVLDLRELQFLDSTGLRLILSWNEKAQEDGFRFGLVRGCTAVQRLFELTGTTHLLNFVDRRDWSVLVSRPKRLESPGTGGVYAS
jgi:anti-anti-sigma factor